MEDIFIFIRNGNTMQVRMWLDNTENDLNLGDDHQFSLLHWAAKDGHKTIVEMLLSRGVRINATNMGDDTPIHLAAAHGHQEIVLMLLRHKANINAINEHGNTPLHYACFWGHDYVSEDLVNNGALIGLCNRYDECPLDKANENLAKLLREIIEYNAIADRAESIGTDITRQPFRDRSWLGTKTRSRDATLSRKAGIYLSDLGLEDRPLVCTHSGDTYRGMFQENEVAVKILNLRDCSARNVRDFKDEIQVLRIFNHPNVLAVLGGCVEPPNLCLISQFMQFGSLYDIIHDESGIVVDQNQSLKFAMDIARGMEFLHSLDNAIPNLSLNSKHIMIDEDLARINIDDPKYKQSNNGDMINGIDEDLSAKISLADYKFTFHETNKFYDPAWISPEALQKKPVDLNTKASDMWSFAVVLWELTTREVPFADLSPMETGMKIALECLRVEIPPGTSSQMSRLIRICMNEDPGKRPRFDMVLPIIEKMKAAL